MVYCSEAENLGGLLSDVSGRKPCKQRSSRSKCKHLLRVGGNVTEEWKKGGDLARVGKERFESQRLNLMNFATRNLINVGFYFVLVL